MPTSLRFRLYASAADTQVANVTKPGRFCDSRECVTAANAMAVTHGLGHLDPYGI